MSMDNLRDNIVLIIGMVIFIIFIGVIIGLIYNFMALSDTKLYDDENKYINQTLGDVEGNYKDSYQRKINLDAIQLNIISFFNSTRGIFVIAFIILLLFGLILKNRKAILDNLKDFFN